MEELELRREIESYKKEYEEIEARFKVLFEERYGKDADKKTALKGLDYTDELIMLDDDMYILRRAISELEWKLYVQFEGGGC